MPRRKTAVVDAPAKTHKRQLSTPIAVEKATPSTRSSKRIKVNDTPKDQNSTPLKSKYFDGSESEDEDEGTIVGEESGYEDEDASVTEPSEPPTESDEFDSEEEVNKKRPRARKPVRQKTQDEEAIIDRNDLWREGVKTGLGPGKQVFIAKPKAKGDGGIKYAPDRIHPNTMSFLGDLKKNNDREWLKMHDPDYRQSWQDWSSFVDALTEKITEIDDTVPELPPKDLVFRIYRDVRFSKDPTPYKTHFSAAWSRTGRKGPYAAYYVQIQPGGRSFVGSGLWCPDAQPLRLLRRSIDRHPERLRSVLIDANLRKNIFGGVAKDEKKAIKAFAGQNAENALKSKPKGFDVNHPNIELLRLRNFTVGKRLSDEEVLSTEGITTILDLIQTMHPFVTFLNSVVMPDDDQSDSDDDADAANDADEAVDSDDEPR